MVNKEEEIKAYLKNRMTIGEQSLRAMTYDQNKFKLPRRSVALVVDMHLRNFGYGKTEPRWIVIPGLRGVGKTTLIAQLYSEIKCQEFHKIYLSLDDTSRSLGVTLNELLLAYEKILGKKFEELNNPLYLFLDEVQYDPSWAVTLKTLYDRTKKIFIVCTGSSALSIQTNPDVARRAVFTKIYPLSFTEYRMIKDKIFPFQGLGSKIREAIFNSSTAIEVFEKIQPLEAQIKKYYAGVKEKDFIEYLKFGTLPFALTLAKEVLIYPQISHTLSSVLTRDVPQLNTFDKKTLDKLNQILYTVASYESTSFSQISVTIGLNIKTVESVFEALEKTELLIRVYPYGPHESQVRKPSKYLFSSPAFRSMYYNLTGSVASFNEYKGKLFEDTMALYLYRIYAKIPGVNITYDFAQGGADFIVGHGDDQSSKIVIEASLGKKGNKQVYQTMEKVKTKYGLIVASNPLTIDENKKVVTIPVHTFLLI